MLVPSELRRGVDGFVDDIVKQRVLLGTRNPLYQTALEHIRALLEGPTADPTIVMKLDRAWQMRAFYTYYERPLLILAALRNDAIVEGPKHPLWSHFGPEARADQPTVTREAIRAALASERLSFWLTLATRRVQTNEVARAVVWQWPVHLAGCEGGARPVALVDIGAAAGLHLVADRLDLEWTNTRRQRIPIAKHIQAVARVGFDSHPLDLRYDDDLTWLRACIWPTENDRLARLERAVMTLRSMYELPDDAPELYTLQAPLVPSRLTMLRRKISEDTVIVAYQSFLRGYLDPDREANYARGMTAWLETEAPGRAMWTELEIRGEVHDPYPVVLVAHTRTVKGVQTFPLARSSFHPETLLVDDDAAARFAVAMMKSANP